MTNKPRKKQLKININLSDETSIEELRTILTYEAQLRGRPIGQTCYDLVVEGVDLKNYPEELLERMREIDKQSERDAILESLSQFDEDF